MQFPAFQAQTPAPPLVTWGKSLRVPDPHWLHWSNGAASPRGPDGPKLLEQPSCIRPTSSLCTRSPASGTPFYPSLCLHSPCSCFSSHSDALVGEGKLLTSSLRPAQGPLLLPSWYSSSLALSSVCGAVFTSLPSPLTPALQDPWEHKLILPPAQIPAPSRGIGTN